MKIAVLLANMGGPDSLEVVEPFLFEIFNDPHIIDVPMPKFVRRKLAATIARKRKDESIEIYRKLGGKTPLHAIMQKQAESLLQKLNAQAANNAEFSVFPANRYSRPSLESVLSAIRHDGYQRILIVSMYPFFATSTSGSIDREVQRLSKRLAIPEKQIDYLERYGEQADFVHLMAEHIKRQLSGVLRRGNPIQLVFSAHSVPQRHLDKGDPYFEEVRKAVQQLQTELPKQVHLHLAFQSKIGPVTWLGPATDAKIVELAKSGVRELYVYPLGFTADNSETVYEIGMLYRDLALQNGMKKFVRLEALNTFEPFIGFLADMVKQKIFNQ